MNLCTLPFRSRQATINWTAPFNLTEQPSEATLSLVTKVISASHPAMQSITLSILRPVFFQAESAITENQRILEHGERVVLGFLEGWTKSVGDPVISKWIVVTLCVSMGLNAWLLSAVRRGVMHTPQISTIQPAIDRSPPTVDSTPSPPKPSVLVSAATNPLKSTSLSSIDNKGDEKKRLSTARKSTGRLRSVSECLQILDKGRPQDLLDEEIIALTIQKKIPLYALEKTLGDLERAVKIRRAAVCMIPNQF